MTERVKVVFASLLKPVDEPRMYEKLGRSLAQTYKYDVNIIGFASKNLTHDPQISFWPIFNFKRISLQRLLAPLYFFKKILQLKPDVIVLNSPDFMELSALYKIIFGAQIIYDIRDNYYRNIIWSHSKPSLMRRARAGLVRLRERLFDRMVIQYVLAEACYSTECSFITRPCLILENKALQPQIPLPEKSARKEAALKILYSGTIAASYGVLDTIPLTDSIAQIHPNLTYTICGHCPSEEVAQALKKAAAERPWLKLEISATPIPHQQILKALREAHFSLIAYRLNPSNINCIPTRIWEALAWQTPVILKQEHPWKSIIKEYDAGFAADFLNPDRQTLEKLLYRKDYYNKPLPEDTYWQSNETAWLKLMDTLTQQK